MNLRSLIGAALLATLSLACTQAHTQENKALVREHEKIMTQLPNVAHISPQDFSARPTKDIIIFDVRDRAEYEVSHIENAIYIPPDMSRDRFLETYADAAKGKTAIFYCSVGQRSSILADKVQAGLTQQGSRAVYNLEGGLFRWHNEARPLQSTSAQTGRKTASPYIHPYNRYWGRMVNDQSKTRYKAEAP